LTLAELALFWCRKVGPSFFQVLDGSGLFEGVIAEAQADMSFMAGRVIDIVVGGIGDSRIVV
jgi:hypothetical protein